ncbi:MAG: hypothetical protein Q9199_006669, partial [Rusavskia elegans]
YFASWSHFLIIFSTVTSIGAMVATRGQKRTRADSVGSASALSDAALSTSNTAETVCRSSKRAVTTYNVEAQADTDDSDDYSSGDLLFGDEDEDDEDEGILEDELLEPEEGEDQDGWEDVLSDEEDDEVIQDESTPDELQAKLDNIVVVEANVHRFWSRMEDSIMTLKALVMSLPLFNGIVSTQFSLYLNNASVEYLLEVYQLAVPLYVQIILGQETFGPEDLLLLVANWRDPSPGIYLDILTKAHRPTNEWYRLYVGSAAAKGEYQSGRGLWSRISGYWLWWKNRFNYERHQKYKDVGFAHAEAILEPDTQIQFAILAKFREDMDRTCINVLEWLMMVYLQGFKMRRGRQSEYTPDAAYDWAEYCRPDDLPAIGREIGLNLGFPLKQITSGRPQADQICTNCKITREITGKRLQLYSLDKHRPYEQLVCQSCLVHFRRSGEHLDADARRYRHRALECSKSKKRHNDWFCDDCRKPLGQSRGMKRYVEDQKGRGRILCIACTRQQFPIGDRSVNIKFNRKSNPKPKRMDPERHKHPCVACGTFGRIEIGTIRHDRADKKFRCHDCICGLDQVLKRVLALEMGEKELALCTIYKTREEALEHYCRNEGKDLIQCSVDAVTYKPCAACGRSDRLTKAHPEDGKFRCGPCRQHLTRAFRDAPLMKDPLLHKEASLKHYSRNDYPDSAVAVAKLGPVNSPCVACGRTDKKTAVHAIQDGKIRCLNCRGDLVKALKTALSNKDPLRAKEKALQFYSRSENGPAPTIKGTGKPCVACGKYERKTEVHAAQDGKIRCTPCRSSFTLTLKKALNNKDPIEAKEKAIQWYSRNEEKSSQL